MISLTIIYQDFKKSLSSRLTLYEHPKVSEKA